MLPSGEVLSVQQVSVLPKGQEVLDVLGPWTLENYGIAVTGGPGNLKSFHAVEIWPLNFKY